MGYRLTPEERRIIHRTQREGEELYASQTPRKRELRILKSAAVWTVVIFLFVFGAVVIYYLGTFL